MLIFGIPLLLLSWILLSGFFRPVEDPSLHRLAREQALHILAARIRHDLEAVGENGVVTILGNGQGLRLQARTPEARTTAEMIILTEKESENSTPEVRFLTRQDSEKLFCDGPTRMLPGIEKLLFRRGENRELIVEARLRPGRDRHEPWPGLERIFSLPSPASIALN